MTIAPDRLAAAFPSAETSVSADGIRVLLLAPRELPDAIRRLRMRLDMSASST